jgi:ribonuclease HI
MNPQNQSAIIVFVDGASSGNPGPGGWGAIVASPDGKVRELGGGEAFTTNNRMELMGVIRALESLPSNEVPIGIYTDSTYVIRGITQWIWAWRKRNWITAEGQEVANTDLWKKLSAQVLGRKIQWNYVRGHTGIPGNERADEIAVSFSKNQRLSLFNGSLLQYPLPIHDIPENTSLPELKSREKTAKAKPVSYLSLLGSLPMRHSTWEECERRIKGQSGAKFKKAMTPDEETEILRSWGFKSEDLRS